MSSRMSALRTAVTMTIGLGLGLCLASCNDDSGNGNSRTVSGVAKSEISRNTSETSDPILINDLPFSDADTRETGSPEPI